MDPLDKMYYKISDVQELLDLPQSTLRFWERNIPELKPHRSKGGTRYYSPADIERLKMFKYLIREKGLKIEAAREHFAKNRSGVDSTHQVVLKLQEIRRKLVALREALNLRPSKDSILK